MISIAEIISNREDIPSIHYVRVILTNGEGKFLKFKQAEPPSNDQILNSLTQDDSGDNNGVSYQIEPIEAL
jgi:hypothetical protein